jgi:hypothetical protein
MSMPHSKASKGNGDIACIACCTCSSTLPSQSSVLPQRLWKPCDANGVSTDPSSLYHIASGSSRESAIVQTSSPSRT